jgi:predicted outer membrane repeat protein
VDLNHITIHANTATASAGGIGVNFSGGANFNLHDSQVDTNSAYEGAGVYFQGPTGTIFSLSISIINTLIFSNSASLSAGIENHSGSAAFPVLLQNNKIYQNNATGFGGGIGNYGNLTIANTTLDANSATTKGGGIYDYEGGVININQSTLSRNTSTTGGGIYTELFIHNLASVNLTNSTVSSNVASHDGGGIYADGGQVNSFNTTISANQILVPAAISYLGVGGGIYKSANVGFTLENTLLADNTHRYGTALVVPDDCYGFVSSLGYNLIEDTINCTIFGTAPGNIVGQDPKLGPLQNSNGPTQVQVPLIGSPAINAGETPSCTDINSVPILIDQRDVPRPESGRCDIGAVENMPYTELMPILRK